MPQRIALLLMALCCPPALGSYEVDVLADDFAFPWCIGFLPNGEYLVTERGGAMYRLSADGAQRTAIEGVPATYVAGQGGLFDVLVDPAFADNQRIFLSLAGGPPEANATEVYSARLEGNALQAVERIHRVTPDKDTPAHYGGRLALLADGSLLLTTGDGFDYREAAQDRGSQLGKILRMTPRGEPAGALDGQASDDAFVYSYGHRNLQGLAVDANDRVYSTEHGPRGGDELNRITPGGNYGWPIATQGLNYNGAYVSPFQTYPGTEPPALNWTPSIGTSGLAVYTGDAFPDWQGSLFTGGLVDQRVHRLQVDASGNVTDELVFPEIVARIRDVRMGPTGHLYVLTDDPAGQVLRITPAED